MSRDIPFWKLFVADYLAGHMDESCAQFGARMRLLFQQWQKGGQLPDDPEKLRRLVGASGRQWKSMWPALEKEFPESEMGHRANETVAKEYDKASKQHSRNQARSAHAARIKHGQESEYKPPPDDDDCDVTPVYQNPEEPDPLEDCF